MSISINTDPIIRKLVEKLAQNANVEIKNINIDEGHHIITLVKHKSYYRALSITNDGQVFGGHSGGKRKQICVYPHIADPDFFTIMASILDYCLMDEKATSCCNCPGYNHERKK